MLTPSRMICAWFLLSVTMAHADTPSEKKPLLKPGMETVEIGDAKILVPQGAKVYKEGDVIQVEDLSEYSARKFQELEARCNKLQAQYEEINKKTEQLTEMVTGLVKASKTGASARQSDTVPDNK